MFFIVFMVCFPLAFVPFIPSFTSSHPRSPAITTLLSMSMSAFSFWLDPATEL